MHTSASVSRTSASSPDDEMVIDPVLLEEDERARSHSDECQESPIKQTSTTCETQSNSAGPSNSTSPITKTGTNPEGEAGVVPPGWKPKKKRWVLVSDSEDEGPRKKKRGSKGQSAPDKKGKSSRNRKGKNKEVGSNKDGSRDETVVKDEDGEVIKKEKEKKPFVAKKAEWADLRDKMEGDEASLFRLPMEVLDLCFGTSIKLVLGFRDYIALAGVSRLFRERFTDTVFREILHSKGHGDSAKVKTKDAQRIFTRTSTDWRDPPKRQIGPTYKPDHWMPRDIRSTWSEAQYIVYKEEQAHWREKRKLAIEKQTIKREEEEARRIERKAQYIDLNGSCRKVLAKAKGRLDGQPPAERDDQGIPIDAIVISDKDRDKFESRRGSGNPSYRNSASSDEVAPPEQPTTLSESVKVRIARRVQEAKVRNGEEWITPDSEYESDDENLDETWHLEPIDFEVQKQFWPSKYRKRVVELAHEKLINKTDAIRKYKVSAAELLCLKQVLVPNPMNGSVPIQVFSLSAVEALAYRSHGGPFGHRIHVKKANDKIAKGLKTRRDKVAKAKKDGTYIAKKKKHQIRPFDWKNRDAPHVKHCNVEGCTCNDASDKDGEDHKAEGSSEGGVRPGSRLADGARSGPVSGVTGHEGGGGHGSSSEDDDENESDAERDGDGRSRGEVEVQDSDSDD